MGYGYVNKKYSVGDADKILRELSKNKLIFTRHSFNRESERDINENYIKKVIFEVDPLDMIVDNNDNEFKVFYPSELHSDKELIVVIAIDGTKNVIVQSVWEEKRYL